MLQMPFFSVRFGVDVGGKLSWRYVGWSLQYAGFARLTRIGGLNCAEGGRIFLSFGFSVDWVADSSALF